MRRLIAMATLLAAVAFPSVVLGEDILGGDALKITDHGTSCSVVTVSGGQAVQCEGKFSGLGSHTVTITVTAEFMCTNRGGNNPPGQVSGSSGPLTPENGQITFGGTSDNPAVTTSAASCPDQMLPTFGPAFITLTLDDGSSKTFGPYPVY